MNHQQRQQLARVGFNAWLFCGPIVKTIKAEAQDMKLKLTEQDIIRVVATIDRKIKDQEPNQAGK